MNIIKKTSLLLIMFIPIKFIVLSPLLISLLSLLIATYNVYVTAKRRESDKKVILMSYPFEKKFTISQMLKENFEKSIKFNIENISDNPAVLPEFTVNNSKLLLKSRDSNSWSFRLTNILPKGVKNYSVSIDKIYADILLNYKENELNYETIVRKNGQYTYNLNFDIKYFDYNSNQYMIISKTLEIEIIYKMLDNNSASSQYLLSQLHKPVTTEEQSKLLVTVAFKPVVFSY